MLARPYAFFSMTTARSAGRALSVVALSALFGFGLASCGKSKSGGSGASGTTELNADSAVPLLLSYSRQNCRMDITEIVGSQWVPATRAWRAKLLGSGYTLASSAGGVDTLNYQYQGDTMRVLLTEPISGDLSIQGCVNVAGSVSVLDTTIDPTGKSATITFRYGSKMRTPFGNDLYAFVPSPSNDVQADEQSGDWTSEHRAFLQKLDATGWRVDSIQ